MDPNANLQEQSELLEFETRWHRDDRARMNELRGALRAWLDRGGFAPDWTHWRKATRRFKAWRQRNG